MALCITTWCILDGPAAFGIDGASDVTEEFGAKRTNVELRLMYGGTPSAPRLGR